MNKYLYIFLLILLVVSVCLNIGMYKHINAEVAHTDTIEVVMWDTIHDTLPEVRHEKIVKYIHVQDSVFITDTVSKAVMLPIVQRTFTDDSTYTAYVSGARIDSFPRLDSISVRRQMIERTITNTIYRDKRGVRLKLRPSLSTGYDPINRQWCVLVGGAVVIDW